MLVNNERFADVNRPVRPLRRIVQLHIRRVASTGIIPAVGRLQRHAVQFLHHGQIPVRLQRLQPGAERGAHDPAANQQEVGFFRGIRFSMRRRADQHR